MKKIDISLPKKLGRSSKTSSPTYFKFWKSKKINTNLNSKPYICEYHNNSPRKLEDHVPLPITIKITNYEPKKSKSKYGCNCFKKKPSKVQIQRECNKNNIVEVPKDTMMVMEGQNKVTKTIKVDEMKFNVVDTRRKKGPKVLHKIKILMLRRKKVPQNLLSKDDKSNKNEIQNKKEDKLCGCFGQSKPKDLKPKAIVNNEVSLIHENNSELVATTKIDGIESNSTTSSINAIKSE